MERAIVHMDLDTFFVSCERLGNAQLQGIPLIIGGGDRGVVASCSYEARRFGVRSAMPIKMALAMCPQARVIKGDMELYSKMSSLVTEVIEERSPLTEKASIDEFYLDITGMDRFHGSYKWTSELAQAVTRETGLPISFALSVNKTVSKIGTGEAKPTGRLEIPTDNVRRFLNPLSIKKIPMVGDATFALLSRIGIRTIQTLSEMPAPVLQQMVGKNGIEIWKKANGIDTSPVEPYTERKSISTEHTFGQDTIDIPMLRALLSGMVEKLAYQLRSEQWLASTVTVKIRYSNFDTETKQCRIPYTSCDHALARHVKELFEKLYQRRMRLRLVGLRFSGLVRGTYQINLFEDYDREHEGMDALRELAQKFAIDPRFCCYGRPMAGEFTPQQNTAPLPDIGLHNASIEEALARLKDGQESYAYLDRGRHAEERSCVYVENGAFCGMGYFPSDATVSDLSELKEYIDPYKSSHYIMKLIASFAARHPGKVKPIKKETAPKRNEF